MGCPTHEPAGRAAISSPSRMSTTRARIRLHPAGNADGAAQAEVGFEPTNNGFAIRPLGPLGYSAECEGIIRYRSRDNEPVGDSRGSAGSFTQQTVTGRGIVAARGVQPSSSSTAARTASAPGAGPSGDAGWSRDRNAPRRSTSTGDLPNSHAVEDSFPTRLILTMRGRPVSGS